jgi:putative ABC transport system permease protein
VERSPGRLLRALARLLVRGPDAPYILGDMDEALQRDQARGMSLPQARIRFLANALSSGVTLLRERFRLSRGGRPGASWIDVKLGWRILWKTPLLTAVAALALAVGIPVGLAPLHVMDAVEAPPPVPDAERLVGLRFASTGRGGAPATSYELAFWRQSLTSYEAIGAVRQVDRNFASDAGAGVPVRAAEVTSSTFPILRARPLLGRTLHAADEVPGSEDVVVVSHALWQSRLAADPGIVGSTVHIAGVPHTVIGVMPEGFHFPVREQLWLPLQQRAASEPGQDLPLQVFARLAGGVEERVAQAELAAVHAVMAAQFPASHGSVRAEVVSLTSLVAGFPKGGLRAMPGVGPLSFLALLQLIALALLLVACANVGLLIFARTATRAQELALRTALGASRMRIVTQMVVEALVLALLSAGVGLVLGDVLAGTLLVRFWPAGLAEMPWWVDLGVNATTVVRAFVLAVFCAGIAVLIPAVRLTGPAIRSNMRATETGGFGVRFGGLWTALIIADVAIAVAVVGMAAAIGGRLHAVSSGRQLSGVAAEQYLAVELQLPVTTAAADTAATAALRDHLARTQQRLVQRLHAEPGVRAVAVAERLPRMDHWALRVEVEHAGVDGMEVVRIDPGFFAAFGRSVRSGRDFDGRDIHGDRLAAIVNASFAREMLDGRNPVGHRLRVLAYDDGEPGPWLEIVGLVDDLGTDLLQPDDAHAVYVPAAPGEMNPFGLAVHVASDPASFAARVRELAAEADPGIMVTRALPLSDVVPQEWYEMAALGAAWSVLAGILLALAGSGVYAIMAFAVTQRTREVGIRTALGARRSDIVSTIGRRAALQLGAGALVGMPLATWIHFLTRAEPTSTLHILMVAVVPAVLIVLAVGLAACTGPLRRALRVAPNHAIRTAS